MIAMPNDIRYMVVAVATACMLPFVFAILSRITGGFDISKDNHNPRAFLTKTTGLSARLNATQANSFEGLPIFLASIVIAMYCFVPQHVINTLAWLYVVLRIIYGVAYALDLALFRSIIWGLSLACCLQLFYFSFRLS